MVVGCDDLRLSKRQSKTKRERLGFPAESLGARISGGLGKANTQCHGEVVGSFVKSAIGYMRLAIRQPSVNSVPFCKILPHFLDPFRPLKSQISNRLLPICDWLFHCPPLPRFPSVKSCPTALDPFPFLSRLLAICDWLFHCPPFAFQNSLPLRLLIAP